MRDMDSAYQDALDEIAELKAELSSARAEVERLTIRDGLYAKLREKIAEYFGGDGGYAVLQDGVCALRKSESTARERADRAEQTIRTMQALAGEPAPYVRTYTTGSSSTTTPDHA